MDVLHLSYHYHSMHSIGKIVLNLLDNCNLKQGNIDLPKDFYALVREIEKIKPKILHIHLNSKLDVPRLIRMLSYKPILVQTLHGDVSSQFSGWMDKIICIHKPCYDRNDPSKSIIIENTVDVPIHENLGDMSICSTFRFVPERVNKKIIQAYENIKADVHLYGAVTAFDLERTQKLVSPVSNVSLKRWNRNVVELLGRYKIYTFYLSDDINQKDYCYGLCVMEAAASGIPVVAIQRTQNYQKYIIDGYNGFIVSNEEEFVKACNRLVSDKSLLSTMKVNAVRRARTICNSMPKSYEDLYRGLIK